MTATYPPARAPTADELLHDPAVRQAIDQAWTDSQATDPVHRHEEGGWIYMDTSTGHISIQRAPKGTGAAIDLRNPPAVTHSVVVGVFHTHPNPQSEGWSLGPSNADLLIDARNGVPDLIRAEDGVHLSGPDTRRGGLTGGPGYPP